jgi:hypothetical protein
MTQIQGANSAQYSLAWLLSASQAGTTNTSTAFDPTAGMTQGATPALDAGAAAPPQQPLSLDMMRALMGAQEQANGLSPDQQKVFGELDTDGDGKVTAAELQADFGTDNKALADAVMKKLDTNGDGSIDQSEFAAKTKKHLHHHHAPQGLDALLQATQGTSTDSSATTGTTQAQTQSDLLQQLLKLQAQLTTPATQSATAATV